MGHISNAIGSRVPQRSGRLSVSVICAMVPRRGRGSTSSRRPTRCTARDCWSTFTAATGRSSRRTTSRFSRQPGTKPDSPAQSSATRSHQRRVFRPLSPSVAKRSLAARARRRARFRFPEHGRRRQFGGRIPCRRVRRSFVHSSPRHGVRLGYLRCGAAHRHVDQRRPRTGCGNCGLARPVDGGSPVLPRGRWLG